MVKAKVQTNILGFSFSKWGMKDTVDYVVSYLHKDRAEFPHTVHIVTANPEIVMTGLENQELAQAMHTADLITPDGTGIVWAAEHLGDPMPERVAGYDMLHEIAKTSNERPFSVFLLGANEEVNSKAANQLAKQYPHVTVVGRRNGYFDDSQEPEIFDEINALKPDLLLVALGFPKQELWIQRYKQQLQAKVAIGVGGSFDVLAGVVKRAPMMWQKLRLEWLHRLLSQPSRLPRQLAIPKFVLRIKKEKKKQLSK
ncbi:WecB/TagA/CpsF family glycosyltransferase [Bacillus horti]|uniref:N-acetylglucosaminyldiphosphoundecaprenol N-acetyl-beta-D-mannosaminyltransferase n=1 Tax=Caldalkalibacillus horti TaxID=77523 RepID=A0ABT9VZV0_9BACI|nr:WecB/TagA/CpsF family glycosyltransferase [Bacillus horti]MDQ0166385.1 N-acetylglucosaminyldiphosphoundecaprenol N-acetyl-beta-D-mannosaminyltransferase [Bacillus horti]